MADYVEQQLGNYQLIRLLGQGGFANVYLAEHVYLKTSAAIKVLQVRLTDDALDRFLAEAQTIARLSHPHIIRVLEFGIEQGTPFLVMNYAPYGSLRQRHPIGSVLANSQILSYVRQIASALQYAHDRMIIHRDVKPENMLLDETLMLSDFGLATTVQKQSYDAQSMPVHHTRNVAGTTTYMAPEQFDGIPSPASDQYALAVVIYEWLCGTPPFRGSDMGVAIQHIQKLPPPLREQAPSLAPAIEQAVFRALAKDPRQRFPSVQDFAHTLEMAMSFSTGYGSGLTLKTPPGSPSSSNPIQRPLSTPGSHLLDYASPTVADHGFAPGALSRYSAPDLHTHYPQPTPYPGIHSHMQDHQSLIDRRKVIIGLASMAGGLAVLTGGSIWFALAQRGNTTAPSAQNTAVVPNSPPPNAEATAQARIDVTNSKPGAVVLATNHLNLFVRDSANALWRRDYTGSWRNWEALGGSLAFDPVAISWDGQRIDLFMRGVDNTLQHRLYDGTWHDWESLGGSLASDPAVVSWQPGRFDVFVRGAADNALWHIWYDGSWHDWGSLGGGITATPAVAAWAPNRIDVFVRGSDNALWHIAWDTAYWSGWERLGNSLMDAPAATSWGPKRLDVFTRGTDMTLQHIWYDGSNGGSASWQPWESLGGQMGTAPTAVSWGNNRIDIFARDPGKALQHTWFDGTWHSWSPLPQ
jgi:serine/threonine protein kinase